MTVEEARKRRVCRICQEVIPAVPAPMGWTHEFRQQLFPVALTLNFGEEFAHTACLENEQALAEATA